MTNFLFRRASVDDLDLLLDTRIKVLLAVNQLPADTDMSAILDTTRTYYREYLGSDSHTAYLAFDNGALAACGAICYYQLMPTYHNPSGKMGYIMNMYTHPPYRRRGLATKILDLLIEDAVGKGVRHIQLDATAQGRPVYEKYGFHPMPAELAYSVD